MIQEFVKKPVKISAIQWTGENEHEIMDFVGMKLQVSRPPNHYEHDNDITDDMVTITIPTLEDGKYGQVAHVADRNDWIIKGVKGEFYPCKPDIFKATYRAVKTLQEEHIPQFQESLDSMSEEDKKKVDDRMERNHPVYSEANVIQIIDALLQMPDQLTDAINNENTDYDAEKLFNLAEGQIRLVRNKD